MTQVTGCRCGYLYKDGDIFCADCGRPRALPAMTDTPPPPATRPGPGAPQRQDGSYFTHASARPPEPMSNATRYLCAAAYLDAAFANGVIGELVASHRAVAPSRGIDLVPIVRHCLKARNMQLTRDVLLTTLLLIGVFLALSPLVLILVITFVLSFLPGPHWERRSVGAG